MFYKHKASKHIEAENVQKIKHILRMSLAWGKHIMSRITVKKSNFVYPYFSLTPSFNKTLRQFYEKNNQICIIRNLK